MQMDPEVRPDAVECIEVISKHLRLPQNGSGKFRDAPMRASSGESPTAYRRPSSASTIDARSPGPRSNSSEMKTTGGRSSSTIEARSSGPRSNSSELKTTGGRSSSGENKPPLWQVT